MTLKKILIVALPVICSQASAQSGWYLKPTAGIGFSNIHSKPITINGITLAHDNKNILSYNGAITIGKRIKNLDISIGVQYLTTGYKWDITFENFYTNTSEPARITYRYYHMLVPVQLGYHIALGKRLSFTPQLGAAFSYTGTASSHLKSASIDDRKSHGTANSLTYQPYGAFGICHLNLEYAISNRFAVSAAPTGYYLITKANKMPSGSVFDPKDHNYAYGIDAGVRINFGKVKTKEKATAEVQ